MVAKESSSCSLSGFTDEEGTSCGRHLQSSEIVPADASQPNAEEKVTVEVIQRDDIDSLELEETSKTAQELEAARDECPSNLIGLASLPINLKLDARSGMKASVGGFVKSVIASIADWGMESIKASANRCHRLESVLEKLKDITMLTMMVQGTALMVQGTALMEINKEVTELVEEGENIYSSLIDSTILSRWFLYKKVRDFEKKARNLATKLEIEMRTRLLIEVTTDIERQFPEHAGGIRSPAEEVIAQDSGIETKTDTIVKENEVRRFVINQKSENAQETERPIISANENEEIRGCIDAYNELEQKVKESLHDIHSFFNGWDWREVANIVGTHELDTLEDRALVIKEANTVRVHDAIKSNCRQDTHGTVLTNASQIQALLEKNETKDIQRITGIWLLHENKGSPSMTAAKLDLMCHSLRVLALGKFGKVEGKCRGVFDKMVFFQAGIPQLPFKVGRIKKLRYFSFEHEDFQLQKGYSNGYVRLNSKLQYPRALKMESPWGLSFEMTNTGKALKRMELYLPEPKCRCLDGLRYKRSLLDLVSLWDLKRPGDPHDPYGFFVALKDALFGLKKLTSLEVLPHRLGNLICLGREINLLKHHEQSSIDLESLAHLMSILCSLEISSCSVPHNSQDLFRDIPSFVPFSLARCSSLEKLLSRFGKLKGLRVLNLQHCWLLKKLPEGLGELEYLVVLDLSFCCSLQDFCTNFHLLRSLQILNLNYCESLKKLPEDFHLLVSLQFLSLQFCKTLEGKSMDSVTKCEKLEKLFIEGSPMLEERWEAMKKKGKQSSSLVVYTKEEGTSDKDNRASQL